MSLEFGLILRYNLSKDRGVDGRIILKGVLEKWDGYMAWIWTGGGLL
jgi:hypothetical protein